MSTDWMPRGACRSVDPDLFFGPEWEEPQARLTREARAKAVCARCPVTAECEAYAKAAGIRFGVWAGLADDEVLNGPRKCRNGLHVMDFGNSRFDYRGYQQCRACAAAQQQRFDAKERAA